MEIKGRDVSLYLSGQQVLVDGCNIAITQPTIKQIVVYGEDFFLQSLQLLANPEPIVEAMKKDNPQLSVLSDFQLILIILNQDRTLATSIGDFLKLIFPQYVIYIKESSVEFFVEDQMVGMINPFNFESFQRTIKDLFIFNSGEDDEYKPADDKAAEIAEKLKKGREKVASLRNGGKETSGSSLFGTLVSTLSIGMQMDINVFLNYTPFQLYDSFNRFNAKDYSDFYRKAASTPLIDVSSMEEPKAWQRDLYI